MAPHVAVSNDSMMPKDIQLSFGKYLVENKADSVR